MGKLLDIKKNRFIFINYYLHFPVVMILFVAFFPFSAYASMNRGTNLQCPSRKNIIISTFNQQLTTMMWDNHFIIASKPKKTHTNAGVPVIVTFFQNGDSLVYFIKNRIYWLYYANDVKIEKCRVDNIFNYPYTPLHRLHETSH